MGQWQKRPRRISRRGSRAARGGRTLCGGGRHGFGALLGQPLKQVAQLLLPFGAEALGDVPFPRGMELVGAL
jgi:hypothetical protein